MNLYQEKILAWQDLGHRAAVAHQLENIAFITATQGEASRASRLLGAAEALRESLAASMTQQERGEIDQVVESLRRQTDPPVLNQAWQIGRVMSMDEAIAFALEPVG